MNLSVQQLQHDSWLGIVDEALGSSGLPAHYLDLEITESVIITHPERAVATLVKLKQRGVSITIDDFGTGYSSLSYLARLPIQAVKIDQRFVHGLELNRNDESITQAIIALSHSLGLRVIAEGVETAAQFDFLKRHGCEEAQGFLIARPMEEPELRNWWRMQEVENRIVGRQSDMWQARRLTCADPSVAPGAPRSSGEILARIDVAQDAGIVDLDACDVVPMRGDNGLGAFVAGQRRESRVARFAKADRMAAHAAVKRRGNERAVGESAGNARNRRRFDPRHVGQRDDPSRRPWPRPYRAGETLSHSFVSVCTSHDVGAIGT